MTIFLSDGITKQKTEMDIPPPPPLSQKNAYLGGYHLTTADHTIHTFYRDHPHHNYGTHLDWGPADNTINQHQWNHTGNIPMGCYYTTLCQVELHFFTQSMEYIKGVRSRHWNSDPPPCVFEHNPPHNKSCPVLKINDLIQLKTSTFSTHTLVWLHLKNVN